MKKTIKLGVVLGAFLLLAACKTTGSTPGTVVPSTPEITKVSETIAKVQTTARKICAFVPTANTVASILASFGVSSLTQATGIASDICNALSERKLMAARPGLERMQYRKVSPPSVNGVVIQGRFVR